MNTKSRSVYRQRGIALVTAIFVVALATIAAVALFESSSIAVRRAANLQESETEWWYAVGIESWVKSILKQDAKLNDIDGLGDIWAQQGIVLPVDNGVIRGSIVDLQGLFNLNNLGVQDPTQAKANLAQFQRLLDNLPGLDASQYRGIGDAIRDWIDVDSERSGTFGAEDNEYLGMDPPYRAANRPMSSVSELLAVKGVTPELFTALKPYVSALPITTAMLNLNTAPEAVLMSLSANIDRAALQRFLETRKAKPAKTYSDVSGTSPQSFLPADVKQNTVDFKTSYFELQAEVFIGSGRLALYSVYSRPAGGGNPVVIAHSTDSD
jgi:general secretion pathway protein K